MACSSSQPVQSGYVEAERLFEQKKFVESAKSLSRLLDEDPYFPGARGLLARCFFFLGNPNRSFEETQWVLSHVPVGTPQSLDALFLMGAIAAESPSLSETYQKKGLEAWRIYLKVAPKSELRDQIQAGLQQMKALEDPAQATALARSYVQKSQPEKALAIFERILKKKPNYVPAWHYQGMALIMSGDPVKAAKSWKEVIRLDPAYAKKFKLDERIKVAEKL